MPKKRRNLPTAHVLGTFELSDGTSVVGDLRVKGAKTLLELHSAEYVPRISPGACLRGVAYSGEHITLIDCISAGWGGSSRDPPRFHANVFPHYVAIGQQHLEPERPIIKSIEFSATDLATLFYDFDAFSHLIDAKPVIEAVLQERRETRPVEAGPWPQVCYFTGKECVVEVETVLGRVSVQHRPHSNLGGPGGVFIRNQMVAAIEPSEPVSLKDALDRMHSVTCFFSMAAGRAQGVDNVSITTTGEIAERSPHLKLHLSHRIKLSSDIERHRPHPADVPFDPIEHRDEFSNVLSDWVARHDKWRVSRVRYLGCMRKGDRYGVNRLVAAANMFDILPADAVPVPAMLTDDLAATRDACIEMFGKLPEGSDRNSALSALGRLGQPSLPKKVAHRIAIVDSQLGHRLPDLQLVASVAIKCRNFFVHGSSKDFDYARVEALLPFLTDALEFIFAASDFIEAGWDSKRWISESHSWGHNFARFLWGYRESLNDLRHAVTR